jgi:ABC-type multidrug transport system fused ATPase/permease subunit
VSSAFGSGFGGGPNSMLQSFGAHREGGSAGALLRGVRYLRPHTPRMLAAFGCMMVTTALSLLVPLLIKIAIDGPIAAGDVLGLMGVTLALGAAFAGIYGLSALQRYLLSWVGQRVLATLRAELFRHLQRLSVSYHDRHIIGVTISHVIGDVAVINEALSQGLVAIAGDTLLLAGIVVAMLTFDVQLALVTFAVVPLMLLATWVFSLRARRAFRITRERVAGMVGNLAEAIAGMGVIQAFGQQRVARHRFREVNEANRDSHISAASLTFTFMPSVELLAMVATAAILLFGGLAVARGTLTLGVVVAFLAYLSRFFQPIQELSQLYATMQSAMAGAENVMRLLDTKPAVRDRRGAQAGPEPWQPWLTGRVELRGVDFAYRTGAPVLQGVDLLIEAGQTAALVGPTGAGKTTIASLIARFYEVSTGAVLLDDHDVRDLAQQNLRRHLALVPQEPFLFAGTIRANIAFGRPGADAKAVAAAGAAAGLDRFVTSLPRGYDTAVTEFGRNLSVGQRQLVSVARAVLADPRILIMDEATSSVDSVTESIIQRALRRLLAGRTAIIIAHRLATIRNADVIFVIEAGRVVERGAHDELMARGGPYAALNRRQMMAFGSGGQ